MFHIKSEYLVNHLVNFYISLEKCEKLQYFCSSVINLHKMWNDNVERLSSAPAVKN